MIAARHSTTPIQNIGEWWMRRQSRGRAVDFILISSSAQRDRLCRVVIPAYWQTILPSGCAQNSTFPVQRSSRCTPIDDETICHRNSIDSEIAMSTVATITVAEIWKFMVRICLRRPPVRQIVPAPDLFTPDNAAGDHATTDLSKIKGPENVRHYGVAAAKMKGNEHVDFA